MDFTASINEATSTITIANGAEKIVLATADGVKASQAIKFSSTLFDTPVLPEFLAFSPFRVRFTADGGAQLVKEGNGFVSFNKETYEDLIAIINTTINQCTDKLRIRGGPGPGRGGFNTPDPVF